MDGTVFNTRKKVWREMRVMIQSKPTIIRTTTIGLYPNRENADHFP